MDDERIAEAAKPRPDDVYGRIWPSDELRNVSADGRAMGARAARIFRAALNRDQQP